MPSLSLLGCASAELAWSLASSNSSLCAHKADCSKFCEEDEQAPHGSAHLLITAIMSELTEVDLAQALPQQLVRGIAALPNLR